MLDHFSHLVKRENLDISPEKELICRVGVVEKMCGEEEPMGEQDKWSSEQWHEVKKGDTLSKIAEKYYGDASLYMTIFEANRNILSDPNLIKIGQKLRIP